MKFILCFLLLGTSAFANCDIKALKREMLAQYKTVLPVTNEKGEVGEARAKNFSVSDYMMKLKTENLIIANFDLDIDWKNGKTQTVKTLVVGTVDMATCTVDTYESGDELGTSMANN